jgi:hypothetical protein
MGEAQEDCGNCPSGYFCPQQTSSPQICPRGYYCPESTEIPISCPIGTFGAGEGLSALEDCTACYGGRYCSQYGLEEPDGKCDKAYYCVDQSMTPVPTTLWVGDVGNECERGGYCPQGSKYPRPCLPGYHNQQPGQDHNGRCQACPAGQYCTGDPDPVRADVSSFLAGIIPAKDPTGLCHAGYYCTGTSSNPKQHMATPGHYTIGGASAEANCVAGNF